MTVPARCPREDYELTQGARCTAGSTHGAALICQEVQKGWAGGAGGGGASGLSHPGGGAIPLAGSAFWQGRPHAWRGRQARSHPHGAAVPSPVWVPMSEPRKCSAGPLAFGLKPDDMDWSRPWRIRTRAGLGACRRVRGTRGSVTQQSHFSKFCTALFFQFSNF